MKKMISLLLTTTLLLSGCFNNESNNDTHKKQNDDKVSESENFNDSNVKKDKITPGENDKRLDFNKDMVLISIDEHSNSTMKDRPMGGSSSESAYIMDNELYFFGDSELPTKDSEIIVLEKTYGDLDYLLNHNLYIDDSNETNITINTIDDENVVNEKRLFINENLNIKSTEESLVEVSMNNEKVALKSGESKSFIREDGDVKTELIITNHGTFNSVKNMWYQDVDYKELFEANNL